MDFIKYTFNEDEWTIYLVEDDDDIVTDDGNEAEVLPENKEIYFRKAYLRLNVVMHEVFHVYFKYCYLGDTDINLTQMEEVACSLFADKAERMVTTSKDILKQLKKLKDNNKGDK